MVYRELEKNLEYIQEKTGGDKTFDLIIRKFEIGGRKAALVFIDGFVDAEILTRVMQSLQGVKREEVCVNFVEKLLLRHIPVVESECNSDLKVGLEEVLSGPQMLLIDGEEQSIIIDSRTWESRAPEEPELEKATRGPADGFAETLIFNIALVRRRIRDPNLRVEPFKVGRRSRTDLAILYLEDVADGDLVEKIRGKLEKINLDGLPLADKTIEELLTGNIWNPFPLIRYTERPDNVAAHLLEGHLAVLVDTSPTAVLLPAPFLSQTQSLEEYRQGTIIGSYLTSLRFISLLISVILPPLWLVLALNRDVLPDFLKFLGPKEVTVIPLALQFILASLGIDILRMASISTPGSLATSLGLIGALFLGEFAVDVGLFVPEVILYIALAAVCTFSIPGFELSLLLQVLRLILLLGVALFNWIGFIVATMAIFFLMVFTKSFGVPYLWPLIPLNFLVLKTFIARQSILTLPEKRPPQAQKSSSRRTGGSEEDA